MSTNIGKPQSIEWQGKQVKTGIFKYPVQKPILLGTHDVQNDSVIDRKHHGGINKACYLYSADHYNWWQEHFPDVKMPFGMFGENLTVAGLHEKDIHIGDILQAGEAIVQVTQPRQPCYKLGIRFGNSDVVKQFVKSGFSGIYVRVIQKGFVKTGDIMACIDKKNSISVQKVFELLYTSVFQKEILEKALDTPYLAESCRNDLLKRWKDI